MTLISRNKSQINISRQVHKRIKDYALKENLFLEEATEIIFNKGRDSRRSLSGRRGVDTHAALTILVVPMEAHDWIKKTAESNNQSQRFVAEHVFSDGLDAVFNEMEMAAY
jgi:hypothetical protein